MKGQKTKERKQLEKTPRLCSHYTNWQLLRRYSMNSNSLGEHKSFTHIEHRAGAVGREGLVHSIPVLTREYLLPPQWVPRPPHLSTVFTLHQSMAQKLSDMWLSTFVIDEAQLWSVPEIATKSTSVSCVWTKALSVSMDMIFVAAQKLSSIVRTA